MPNKVEIKNEKSIESYFVVLFCRLRSVFKLWAEQTLIEIIYSKFLPNDNKVRNIFKKRKIGFYQYKNENTEEAKFKQDKVD